MAWKLYPLPDQMAWKPNPLQRQLPYSQYRGVTTPVNTILEAKLTRWKAASNCIVKLAGEEKLKWRRLYKIPTKGRESGKPWEAIAIFPAVCAKSQTDAVAFVSIE